MARARVAGVSGRVVNLDSVEAVRGRGGLSREFVITWRDRLASNEKVVEGRFWDSPTTGEPEVSIEAGMRDRDLRLGDRIRFDILGRTITARVTSVREVDWDNPREGGFIFVFRPGPLDRSPHGYLGIARGPDAPAERARLQRDLVAAWPNVSVIDVREVIATISRIVSLAALGIRVVGTVALVCGLTDPDRRRGDDQVPAAARGGAAQDTRCQLADDHGAAGDRVRRARPDRRPGRRARRDRPQLRARALRPGRAVAAGAGDDRRRRRR